MHRLVEIYYNLGLIDEAQKTAKTLGYNYNSSEWYENSYALLNKDYEKEKNILEKASKKKESGLIKRTINKILKNEKEKGYTKKIYHKRNLILKYNHHYFNLDSPINLRR